VIFRVAMRKLFLLAALVPCIALLFGCPKKADPADAGDEAAVTAVVEAGPVAPVAKNAADIARFGTDTPIANEQAKLLAAFTQVHTSPRGGAVITSLKPGTDVTKIASHSDTFLITFTDPKDATSVLMGWVGKEAFSPTIVLLDAGKVDAATPALVCAPGTVAVFLGGANVCKKKCNADKDCTNAVVGSCVLGALGGVGGKAVHVCQNN
jgi:hypothetical protein